MIANWGVCEWLLLWGVLSVVPAAVIAVAMYMAGTTGHDIIWESVDRRLEELRKQRDGEQ